MLRPWHPAVKQMGKIVQQQVLLSSGWLAGKAKIMT
jgi:hypothetical protein